MLNHFKQKMHNKEAVIGVIGLGYVGLPLMLRFAEVGYRVIGIDTDERKNELLIEGSHTFKTSRLKKLQAFNGSSQRHPIFQHA